MHTAADIRRMLAENAALGERASEHREKIGAAATQELERVNERLSALTAGSVVTDEVKAHEYRQLIEDRGRLLNLLASGDAKRG